VRTVHLLGVAATSFSQTGRGATQLAAEAAGAALADAGLRARDVGLVVVATAGQGAAADGLGPIGDRAQDAGSAVAALHAGWQAVAAGAHDVVLCVGRQAPAGADGDSPLAALAADAERYMGSSGATEEHFARVAAKNRRFGADNPRALQRTPVAAADVLDSEVVAWPLRRLMVAPLAEGAAALVLAARDAGRRLGARAPRILACVLVHEPAGFDAAAARAARLAYGAARLGPEDVDCAEVGGLSAAGEMAAYEALQLAPEGRGPELVDAGFTDRGGVVPVNTSGGALAVGDAPGVGALAQLCELAWQLRGEAGRRQVAGARVGLALAAGQEDGQVALTILGPG
jgi:acetyl-CoA acetyltransferase